jgi:hypothetical protein
MMRNHRFWQLIGAYLLLLSSCAAPNTSSQFPATLQQTVTPTAIQEAPATCPVTRPPEVPFVPPAPYPAKLPPGYVGQFWYGTLKLWTMLMADGVWYALPLSTAGYTQKVFWWRQGYNMDAEPAPQLTVTGRRLDATAPPLVASQATNASADFGQAILVGIDVPTLGCWEITGHYHGHELSFIVWVAP